MEHQKDTRDVKLTASEWSVLTCLWENSPRTVMQLVAALGERVGWAKSTTITTLRRMEEKGLVRAEQSGRGKSYTPAVEREQAATAETRSFLERVYQGSVGLMMSAMAKRQELSAGEVAQLRAILDQAESAIDEIRIQGHTAQQLPDTPNDSHFDRYLASNRATEVVWFIQENSSIFPTRLVSEGCGQWRPVASNENLEGRRKNRRVEMIISGRNLEEEKLGDAITQFITQSQGGADQQNP